MLLKGGFILENGNLVQRDILIQENKIVHIQAGIEIVANETVLDVSDKFISPGFIDAHVHWREPGFEYKETIRTGSLSAARGGFTLTMPMPNLNPVPDSLPNLKKQLEIIERDSVIRAYPYASITIEEKGEHLSDFDNLKDQPIAGFSDDGVGVQEAKVMYEAMKLARQANRVVVAHCEENSLIYGGCMHDGKRCHELGLKGIPSICESVQIARDVLLAEASGCHYHVCHVSTKESVRIIRDAKKAGIKVTAEVCPHHLLCDENDIVENNGLWKMNPPLRSREDRLALIEALEDGTIDIIATDHAPHAVDEKEISMDQAKFGIVGSETAFAQLYTAFVKTKRWTLQQLVDWMTIKPAEVFSLPFGKLEEGAFADLTVIDLEKEMMIDRTKFLSKGSNTPFHGQKVFGMPILTICDGKIAWQE